MTTEAEHREDIAKLRGFLDEYDAERTLNPHPFKKGDIVRTDRGQTGIVHSVDEYESDVYIFYLDEDGDVCGPSCGWELERIG